MEIGDYIYFIGNLGQFVMWLLVNWQLNVAETFTDILKPCFLQTKAFESVKSMA